MALMRKTENSTTPNTNAWAPFQMMQELMRWDPFQELGRPTLGLRASDAFVPAFEVRETKDAYVFSADLPGLREDELDISLTGNHLTISGQRSEEKREDGDRVHMYERRYGAFSRSFALPEGVDTEDVEANLEHGVLKISVPKKPEVKPRRISLLKRSNNKA